MIKPRHEITAGDACWLAQDDIDKMIMLQANVVAALPASEKHFLVPIEGTNRQNMIAAGHQVVGHLADQELKAQVIFYNLEKDNLLAKRFVPDQAGSYSVAPGDYYVINAIVEPEWQGHGMMVEMMAWARAELYFDSLAPAPKLWATISIENRAALSAARKLGFATVATGTLKGTDARLYLLQADLFIAASEMAAQSAA